MNPLIIILADLESNIARMDADPRYAQSKELFEKLIARPFPSPSIVTQHLSVEFPYIPQREIYKLVQMVKQLIVLKEAEAQATHACNLASFKNN